MTYTPLYFVPPCVLIENIFQYKLFGRKTPSSKNTNGTKKTNRDVNPSLLYKHLTLKEALDVSVNI